MIQTAFVFPFPLNSLEFSLELFVLWSKNTCFSFRHHVLTIPSQGKIKEDGGEFSYTSFCHTKNFCPKASQQTSPRVSVGDTTSWDVETILPSVLSKTASACRVQSSELLNCGARVYGTEFLVLFNLN